MLKRDLESIKELNSPYYRNIFKMKWNELSIKEKQDLMISYVDSIEVNGEIRQVEISKPMTRTEVMSYIKKLQIMFPSTDYQEIQKEKYNEKKFYLKYERENILNEPLKLIPILNKQGLYNITHYGVIEAPVLPSTIIKI